MIIKSQLINGLDYLINIRKEVAASPIDYASFSGDPMALTAQLKERYLAKFEVECMEYAKTLLNSAPNAAVGIANFLGVLEGLNESLKSCDADKSMCDILLAFIAIVRRNSISVIADLQDPEA